MASSRSKVSGKRRTSKTSAAAWSLGLHCAVVPKSGGESGRFLGDCGEHGLSGRGECLPQGGDLLCDRRELTVVHPQFDVVGQAQVDAAGDVFAGGGNLLLYDTLLQPGMPMAYRKPVTISLPPPLLKQVEQRARKQHQTTSELVREALRRYLDDRKAEEAEWAKLRAYGTKKARELGLRTPDELEETINQIVSDYRRKVRSAHAVASRR